MKRRFYLSPVEGGYILTEDTFSAYSGKDTFTLSGFINHVLPVIP